MSESPPIEAGGLYPHYQSYARQKCFIAYSEQADWAEDLLSACQKVLSQPEINLEADYARKHFHPDIPLRQKALELIANARYGIYDLSSWQDEQGRWQFPRNVFIELGMAIALNRPTLLLRHAKNRDLRLPECLQSLSSEILEFSGETTLKKVLAEHLPQRINILPEQDWWNRYCIFGYRKCEYRELHPQAKKWQTKELNCHISDGLDLDRPDFRAVIEEVLERFNDVRYNYLDALPLTEGYKFLLCSHCQIIRSSPFAIYRINTSTSMETFIAIGISLALEQQFEYRIPKILLTEDKSQIPSLFEGYEIIVANNDKERKKYLGQFLPGVIEKIRTASWKPQPLPFIVTPDEFEAKGSKQISDSYEFGRPVQSSALFINREMEIREILNIVKHSRQPVLVTGKFRTGKTSLLLEIQRRLTSMPYDLPIFIDLSIVESFDDFKRTFVDSILKVTTNDVKSKFQDNKVYPETISELVEFIQTQANDERSLILLLDEFGAIYRNNNNSDIRQIEYTIRHIGQNSERVNLILASPRDVLRHDIYASPLFNIFRHIELSSFNDDAVRKLITQNDKVHFPEHEIEFVISQSSGQPFLIKMLCSLLIDAKNRGRGDIDLDKIINRFHEEVKPYLYLFKVQPDFPLK